MESPFLAKELWGGFFITGYGIEGDEIMSGIVVEKILQMFILILAGEVVYKAKLIDETVSKNLSNLLLLVVSPLLIFEAYQMNFHRKLFHGLLWALLASLITLLSCMVLAFFMFPGKKDNHQLEKIGTIYSNCSFIGIPLVNGVFGSEGVFYMTAYNTIFDILLWTFGVWVMSSETDWKSSLKELINPAIVSVMVGMVCFLSGFRLPEIVMTPVELIGGMNTPLAMMVAGINLARGDLLKSMKNRRLYFICFVKLVLFPLLSIAILYPMQLDFTIAFTVFIGMACPSGATTIMFSERYGKNTSYATEIFVMTTFLALLTIPLVSIPAAYFLQ